MANYYCMHCGTKATSVNSLTTLSCMLHPSGKGKHQLYEGSEKSRYTCKYCGTGSGSISSLTGLSCMRHPNGKGKHSPAM